MKYYIKNISSFSQEKKDEFLSFLDKEKKEQYLKTKNKNRKNALLISNGFLKEKVSEIYNIRKEDLIFSVDEKGKPFCKSHKGIYFSISHSGDFFAVAIDEKEIGIDIEVFKNPTEKLIDRVCSQKEKDLLLLSDNKEKTFTEIWTKKEAYLKALGTGIDRELKSVDTTCLDILTEAYDKFILSVYCL